MQGSSLPHSGKCGHHSLTKSFIGLSLVGGLLSWFRHGGCWKCGYKGGGFGHSLLLVFARLVVVCKPDVRSSIGIGYVCRCTRPGGVVDKGKSGANSKTGSHTTVLFVMILNESRVLSVETRLGSLGHSERFTNSLTPRLDFLVTPAGDVGQILRTSIDGCPYAAKVGNKADGIGFVDTARNGNELNKIIGKCSGLLGFDASRGGILAGFEELQIAASLVGTPAEDQSDIVDERSLGKLFQGILMVFNVYHDQDYAKKIFLTELTDS